VHTIAYRVGYSTRVHVYTRASLTDILASKIARIVEVGGQVSEDSRACPTRTNGQHHTAADCQLWQAERTTRRHSRDDPREDVDVRVDSVEFQLKVTLDTKPVILVTLFTTNLFGWYTY